MTLYLVTGNQGKVREFSALIERPIEQLKIDLVEIQHTNPVEVTRYKLETALRECMEREVEGTIIVEDTSLELTCLNGLPGTGIKQFMERMGNEKLANLTEKMNDYWATARTIIGVTRNPLPPMSGAEYYFLEGATEGDIVRPRGTNGFGWDPIFKPIGSEKTYAEMTPEEKNAVSHRMKAVQELKKYLAQHNIT